MSDVAIILCLPDLVCSEFITSTLLPLMNEGISCEVICKTGMRSEYAREILLNQFVSKSKAEWAFVVDADMQYPQHTLSRLLSRGKRMITGLYFSRGEIAYPVIFEKEPIEKWPKTRMMDYPRHGLVEVGACGHGCLLIHRSVLEQMERPYSQLGPYAGQDVVGSDIRLCLKARQEVGVSIWCDTDIKCGHIKPLPITEETWLRNKERGIEIWEKHVERRRDEQ